MVAVHCHCGHSHSIHVVFVNSYIVKYINININKDIPGAQVAMRLEPLSCVLSTVIRLKTPLRLMFRVREGTVVRAGMGENPL